MPPQARNRGENKPAVNNAALDEDVMRLSRSHKNVHKFVLVAWKGPKK